MPGKNVVIGSQPVEYVQETTFASPTDGTGSWNWFGLVNSWNVTEGVESESLTYLPEYSSTNKLSKRKNVKHREIWEGEVTYNPQNFDLVKFFTGTDGGVSDTVPSIQVGEVNESASQTEYRRMLGGVGEEFTFSVGEDESAEVTGSFIFADGSDWSTTDYVDSANGGTHATEDTSEPFKYDDISNVQYGGTDLGDAIESIEFTVSNSLAMVRDPNSSNSTLLEAIVPTDREITVSLTLTYSDYSMQSDVRSYTAQDLTFDVGSTSFTISDVAFPEAPYELTPEDLVSDSVESDPCTNISWS